MQDNIKSSEVDQRNSNVWRFNEPARIAIGILPTVQHLEFEKCGGLTPGLSVNHAADISSIRPPPRSSEFLSKLTKDLAS
jgi:hypothetical protein